MKKSEIRDMIKEEMAIVERDRDIAKDSREFDEEEALHSKIIISYKKWIDQFKKFKFNGKDKLSFDFYKDVDKHIGKDKWAIFGTRARLLKVYTKMMKEIVIVVNELIKSNGADELAKRKLKLMISDAKQLNSKQIRHRQQYARGEKMFFEGKITIDNEDISIN